MQSAATSSERASSREEQEATLHQMFDTIPDGALPIDEAGLIKFFSAGAERHIWICASRDGRPKCENAQAFADPRGA